MSLTYGDGNVFAYCLNNPIIFVDENGHATHLQCGWYVADPKKPEEVAIEKGQWRAYIGPDAHNNYTKEQIQDYGLSYTNIYNEQVRVYYAPRCSIVIVPKYAIETYIHDYKEEYPVGFSFSVLMGLKKDPAMDFALEY